MQLNPSLATPQQGWRGWAEHSVLIRKLLILAALAAVLIILYECILEKDPDILFIIDRDSAVGEATESAEQIIDNDLIKASQAYANDALVYLDASVWYLANSGLGTVATMIAEVEAGLE